jgi:hypothetical protein
MGVNRRHVWKLLCLRIVEILETLWDYGEVEYSIMLLLYVRLLISQFSKATEAFLSHSDTGLNVNLGRGSKMQLRLGESRYKLICVRLARRLLREPISNFPTGSTAIGQRKKASFGD